MGWDSTAGFRSWLLSSRLKRRQLNHGRGRRGSRNLAGDAGHESDTEAGQVAASTPAGIVRAPVKRHSGNLHVTAAAGFKRLGIAIVAVVALGLAAVAASSWLISADSAREAVKAQIRLATGLDPVIRGPVTVSMFPPDTVELADVVLAESDRPALAADKLTAHLRLLPLLVGRIDISSISLLRPRIALTFEPGGHSNWAALIDALARALKPNADRAALSLSEIRIEDGIIHIDEPGRELAEKLTKVDISLAWPSIAKTFGATGRFTWRGEPFEASLAIGDFYPALIGEPSGLKFRVAGAPFKLAFDGTTSNRPSLKIDGTLAADAPSLRNALRWMGHQPPPGGGPRPAPPPPDPAPR